MARLGGCRYLAMTIVVAVVCFAFSPSSNGEVIKEEIDETEAGLQNDEAANHLLGNYGPVKLGAWGYDQFPTFDHSGYDGIKSIKIGYGEIIDGIQVTYVKNGKTIETLPVGVLGGKPAEIKLDYPNEYLSHIEGSVGSTPYARAAIKGLKLHTNRHTYGPFGWRGGSWRAFDSFTCGKKIVGFYGDTISPRYLASIGVYIDYI